MNRSEQNITLRPSSRIRVFDDYPEILEFKAPTFKDDIYHKIVKGGNLTVYRVVENSKIMYFDSIVPISQFIFRGEDPLFRFFDIISMSKDEKEELIKYSNRQDNALIPVDKISTNFKDHILIRMRCFPGLPLVPEVSSILYDDTLSKNMAKNFNLVFNNRETTFQFIYDSFINILLGLMGSLGLYISDIAPNNVLITANKLESEKFSMSPCFIDLLDLKRFREPLEVDMSRLFSITYERVSQVFIENISEEACFLFPTYEQKNNEKSIKDYNNKINDLFKIIGRPRFITINRNSISGDFVKLEKELSYK